MRKPYVLSAELPRKVYSWKRSENLQICSRILHLIQLMIRIVKKRNEPKCSETHANTLISKGILQLLHRRLVVFRLMGMHQL